MEHEGKIVSSCTLEAQDGMEIRTKGEKVEARRELALKLLLAAHPEDCSTCPKYGKCELQTLMQYMGVSPEGLNRRQKPIPYNDQNPLIIHDMAAVCCAGGASGLAIRSGAWGLLITQKRMARPILPPCSSF